MLTENYPDLNAPDDQAAIKVKRIILDFFLTDVVDEGNNNIKLDAMRIMEPPTSEVNMVSGKEADSASVEEVTSARKCLPLSMEQTSPRIVPKSIKKRMSPTTRILMNEELTSRKNVAFHEENMSKQSQMFESPMFVILVFILSMQFFLIIPRYSLSLDLDIMAVLLFLAFTLGMNVGSKCSKKVEKEISQPQRARIDSETLMKKSLGGSETSLRMGCGILQSIVGTGDSEADSVQCPLKKFPDDAVIGSILNCWSEPVHDEFNVRGANYLKDRIKFPSGPFLFPLRGVDVFLSDNCPENIGR